MDVFLSILYTVLILCGLVVVHEFGHYIVAKKCGINVMEFAIGFGPRLIKWYSKGTEFSFRPILIGGFVKFNDDEEAIKPGDFRAAKVRHKLLTLVAGPAMNVLLAFIIAVVTLCTIGDYVPVVKEVGANTGAYTAGLKEGDVITSINDVKIDFSQDLQAAFKTLGGENVNITVNRDGEQLNMDIPFEDDGNGGTAAGFAMQSEPKVFGFFESIALAFKWLFSLMQEMLSTLGKLFFTGQGLENISGIVGVTVVVGQAAQIGGNFLLMLTAMISLNLAIINLLPIPSLDGGQIIIYAIEGIIKKPVSQKVIGVINMVGLILIFALAGFLIFQDIARLVA